MTGGAGEAGEAAEVKPRKGTASGSDAAPGDKNRGRTAGEAGEETGGITAERLAGADRLPVPAVFHFGERGLESLTAEAAEEGFAFRTDGFSLYAFAFTVDFFYLGYEFHLPGKGEILLSELFSELHIAETVGDVAEVSFSDPELVSVRRAGEDWKLTSRAAFDSEEKLTVTMLRGDVYEIAVRDAKSYVFRFNTSDPAAGYVYSNSKTYGEAFSLAVADSGLAAGSVRPRSSAAPTNGRQSASAGYEFRFWRVDGYQDFGRGEGNPANYGDLYMIRPQVGTAYVSDGPHTFTACFVPAGESFITFDPYVGADPNDGRVYGAVSVGGAKSYEYLDSGGNSHPVYYCYSGSYGMLAEPYDNGVFTGWYLSGTDTLVCESLYFTAPDWLTWDATVQARFRKAESRTVAYRSTNAVSSTGYGGTISIHGQGYSDYVVYEQVLEGHVPSGARAWVYGNLTFVGWRGEDGRLLTRSEDLTLYGPISGDTIYYAEYLESRFNRILLRSNERSYGSVVSNGQDLTDKLQGFSTNSSGNLRLPAVISAIPAENFRFDHWELNGQRFANDTRLNLRDLSVPPDSGTNIQELTAFFRPICKVSYDLGVLRQVGINDASAQHWEDVPWCPKDVRVDREGLETLGEDLYRETLDFASVFTFPDLTRETRVSGTNNGYNLLTHSFKGWTVEGDTSGKVYKPGESVTLYSSVSLTAVWDAYFDGKSGYYGAGYPARYRYNTNTCGFFVRLFDSEFNIGDTSTYTDCLFTTRLIGDPLYAGDGSRDDLSGNSVAQTRSEIDAIDAFLRANAASGIPANEDSAFAGTVMKLELPFPSDEFIFGRIRQWNDKQTEEHKIQIYGQKIPQEQLTGDYYDLRWYVLKDQENSWHIDGMLLPKYAKLVVMKSFTGEQEAIDAVKSGDFYIGVDEKKENTEGEGREQYQLNLRPWSGSNTDGYRYIDGRGQYVWVLDTLLPMKSYWVAEHRYSAPNPFGTAKSYVIFNTAQSGTSGNDSRAEVRQVYSYADEVWVDGIQTVSFTNRYSRPRELSLVKLDGTTKEPLSKVPFRLVLYANQGSGRIEEIPVEARTDESGAIRVVFPETLEVDGRTVRIPSYEPGGFDGRHRFSITELANEGYHGLDAPITGTITLYDDQNAVLALDDPNQPLVQAASDADGLAAIFVTNEPERKQVSVRKSWLSGSERPVNMQLLRNGVPWIGMNITLGADAYLVSQDPVHYTGGWSHTWRDLPDYIDGEKAIYTVREEWIGLPGGTDSLHYNGASDADGYFDYIVNQSQVTDGDGNVSVYVENSPDGGQVIFSKTDEQMAAVAGAEFTVYRDAACGIPVSAENFTEGTDKTRPAVFVSDENGMVTIAGLKTGTYYLQETKAPAGYAIGDDRVFLLTIREANSSLTDPGTGRGVTGITNPVYSAKVSIYKYVTGSREPLEGAVFSLHASRTDGGMNPAPIRGFESLVTGPDGRADVGTLRRGIYYLVEDAAPPGFDRLGEPIRLTVPESGETRISAIKADSNTGLSVSYDGIVFIDNSRGVTLPETGSGREAMLKGISTAMLLAAALFWGLRIRILLTRRRARTGKGGDSKE